MRLLFWVFLVSLGSFGQEVLINDLPDSFKAVPDTENRVMYYFFKEHYVTIDLKTMERKSRPLTLEKDVDIGPCIPVVKNSKVYFLYHYGGLVYELKNDSIKRIDKSYEHKMQNGAAVFVHDDKIFRYSGYGFWSVHNIFTYFSDDTKEWEYKAYKDHSEEAPEIFGALTVQTKDNLYFFHGMTLDPLDRIKIFPTKDVWRYSFDEERWTYLGTSNWSLNRTSEAFKVLEADNLKFIFQDNQVTEIDPDRNILRIYELSPVSKLGHAQMDMMFEDQIVYSYPKGNSTYMVKVPWNQFLGEQIYEGKFYLSSWKRFLPYLYYALGAVLLLFLVKGFVKLRKKKNKVAILSNGLSYKNKFTEFDKETMEILNLLLSAKKVPSAEILKIVEKEQFSPAHNERLKVQKINDLNIKLQTLFGEKEAQIKSVKSKEDKRIRVYTLDRSYF